MTVKDDVDAVVEDVAKNLHFVFCGCESEMHQKQFEARLWELCEEYER